MNGLDSKCELCRVLDKRENSHIIPKFVRKYIFNKIGKGSKFYFNRNPKKPAQDILKTPFLCDSCEDKFEKLETAYANSHFHPYNKDNAHEFIFDEITYKFLVSLSWRVLRVILIKNEVGFLTINTNNAEISMRKYLTGLTPAANNIRLFLILDRDIIASNMGEINAIHLHQTIHFRVYQTPFMELPFPVTHKEGVVIKFGDFYLFCETFVFHDAEKGLQMYDGQKGVWDALEIKPDTGPRNKALQLPDGAKREILLDYSILKEYIPLIKSKVGH